MKNNNILLLMTMPLVALALLLMGAGQFPEWPAPSDQASVQNPLPVTPKTLTNGRTLYDAQCKSCHGAKGLGDGMIPAANLVSEEAQAQSDGSLFWKLQQGRGQMPSFSGLPAEQLWEVIHYLRNLAKPVEVVVKRKSLITLQLVEKDSVKKVIARVFEVTSEGSRIPLADRKVVLGVKRMFGILPLPDAGNYTNAEGYISGVFPDGIPTDTAGNVVITAYIDDPGYEPGTIEEKVAWGETWVYTDITKQRSLWARMRYAPIWLLLSFTAVAGAIWLTILWVMLELKKINDKGRKLV